MAKIEKLPSGSYRARVWYREDGIKKSKSFTAETAKEARILAAEFISGRESKQEENDYLLLSDAMLQYIEAKAPVLSPSTVREYKTYPRLYLHALQKYNIYDITQADVQKAISKEAKNLSPKTIRNIHGFLSAVFRFFRPDFVLNTRLPQRDSSEIQIPTEDEVKALIAHVDGNEVKLPIMLAAYQGLRMSEILGLKWSCVDFDRRIIRIEEAKVINSDKEYESKKPKTVSGNRELKMVDAVYDELVRAPRESAYVVNLRGNQIVNRYRRAQKVLKMDYSFHELRHYACSVMIMLGIPNKYIAGILGHASENMVEKVYGHIMRDKTDNFFDKINEYYK